MTNPERRMLDERVAGRTVPQMFLRTVAARPEAVALRWKDGDDFATCDWREYARQVAHMAGALRGMGVGPGDRVFLMMRNRPEFHVADTAVLFLGATPFSIYNSSAPDQIEYLVQHSKASVGVVEGCFLPGVLEVRESLTNLRGLAVVDDGGSVPDDVVRWSSLLDADPVDLEVEVANARPDDLATIIYTSGTTGPPKGVMLDHTNVCWTVESFREAFASDPTGWKAVSYLPMAHIAERMSSYYMSVSFGYEVTTCPDPTQIVAYLGATRPTVFFAVPRIWEKAYASLNAAVAADPERAAAFRHALDIGWEASQYRARNEELPAELAARFEQADASLAMVRGMIGLDQAIMAITGAAPIPFEILRFFRGLGVPISEIYGLSETSGPMTWTPFCVRPGTVGPPLPGIEVRLAEDGEVQCRGGNVFRGYLDAPDKTAAVLDADGWFSSGDIGQFDDEGYLRIIDRKKEILITAGGKNVSPANLEAAVKAGALIGQACVIGDGRPYVSALVVLDPEVTPAWAKQKGIEGTLAELAVHPDVHAEVQAAIDAANQHFSHAEQIKRFVILAEEWMPDSEELTPTMKLKRRGIHAKHAEAIEKLYE